LWCLSLRAGSADIVGGVILRAERIDGAAPVIDQSVPSRALGAVAVGVLTAIGVDAQRGQDALSCLEDVSGDAGETISIGFVVGPAEDIDQRACAVADVVSVDAVDTSIS
jgi:hypothetical protein